MTQRISFWTAGLQRLAFVLIAVWMVSAPLSLAAQSDAAKKSPSEESAESNGTSKKSAVDDTKVRDVPDDTAIQDRLLRIYKATKWFEDVSVEVKEGVAFLEGSTENDEHVDWATQLANGTEGVTAVVNQMTVSKTFDLSQSMNVVLGSLSALRRDFLAHSPLMVAGIIAIILTALVSRIAEAIVSRITKRSGLRTSMQDLILQLLTIGIWTIGLLISAVIVFPGMTPARALAVLGLGSVAIGFAFKDIFENFFAGILILWKYPFDKGDFIECGDIKGRIEDITIRMSMIRQVDGQLVVVPNAMLFKNPVDVLTDRDTRRTTIICGVAYDADLTEARDAIRSAVESCSSVRQDESVEIFAQEFGDSSINFEVTWWTGPTPKDIRESRNEVVEAVKRALDDAEIEIPFPQRTLWFPEPVQTEMRNGKSEADHEKSVSA